MMLSQLYESELAEPDPCFPPNSRSRVKRNIALYAEMLGYPDPGQCRPEVYVRTRADLRAFISARAPTHLAKNTVKNCYNDVAKLIESGRARGWLAPPASPFYPWPQPNRQIPSPLGKRKVLHLGVFDDRPKEHHTRYTLDAFPPLLGAEMYTYLYWSSHPDEPHPVLGRPPKRIHKNERSVAAIARHWRRIAGYAVHVEGMDADALTLAQLCEPAFAERFKEFILRRSGACTVNVTNLLTDLKTVARYWLQDDAAVKGLLRIFQELPRTQAVCEKEDRWLDLEDIDRIGQSRHPANPRRRELPPTHYQSWLFNHLDDPERYQPYPGWSFKIIAMWVGLSLMFRLWCHRPLRSRQISGLRLTDLIPQANGDYLMLIKGGDLKRARRGGRENRWEAHFPRRLLPLLEEWRERWRPRLLLTSPDQPYLFLNSRGHQWTEGALRQLVERTTLEFTAERPGGPLAINPHQIRSLWATQMVIAGLNFADVCRLLGDTPQVVWDKYFLNQRKRPISQWTRDLAAAIGKGED